ncbi:hypothetical protein [Halobaculum sp. MBLA0143]|uniref:hypothetical protein n=1 Tax=Halobaculum sp. MBLA0143 TaxID=3079933 RepID=UPI0035242610
MPGRRSDDRGTRRALIGTRGEPTELTGTPQVGGHPGTTAPATDDAERSLLSALAVAVTPVVVSSFAVRPGVGLAVSFVGLAAVGLDAARR